MTPATSSLPEPETDAPGNLVDPDAASSDDRDLVSWLQVVFLLPPLRMPSDCGVPFLVPESMPNAPREYRGGIHQGIDFICYEGGHEASVSLDGQVTVANASFIDPTPEERDSLLATAKQLGYTPQAVLEMLYGRFVALDHGIIDDVGHVATLYAHFEGIDSQLRPGLNVEAGASLGEIGNTGTSTAAEGGSRSSSIHLHWEIHIDGVFLGAGLDADDTRILYEALFDRPFLGS